MFMKKQRLMRRARTHYLAYHAIADRYSCGVNLASHINPELSKHAQEFNAALDELAKIDPKCPAQRLPIA